MGVLMFWMRAPRHRTCLVFAAALVAVALQGSRAAGQVISGQPSSDPMPPRGTQSRVVTVDDIIKLQRIVEVTIAPDGRHVAYVVQRLDLARNEVDRRLFIASTDGATPPRDLYASPTLRTVRWLPDSASLALVSKSEGRDQIYRVPLEGAPRPITNHRGHLGNIGEMPYQLSPDGSQVAYIVFDSEAAKRAYEDEARRGIVYTRDLIHLAITDPMLRPQMSAVWVTAVASGQSHAVWQSPRPALAALAPVNALWTSDGRRLVFTYTSTARFRSMDLLSVDVATGVVTPLSTSLGWTARLRAGDTPTQIRFVSEGEFLPGQPRYRLNWYTFDLESRKLTKEESESIGRGGVQTRLAAIERQLRPADGGLVSQCSIDARAMIAACLRQSSINPPEVIVASMSADGVPSGTRQLTNLNPEYLRLTRSAVRSMDIEVGDGRKVSVGVLDPLQPVPEAGSPLLVMTYNLHRPGEFVAEAGWNTSWPAQAFAGKGYTVLLVNFPSSTFSSDDIADAERNEAALPAAVVRKAIDRIARERRIDRSRIGMLGWSWSSFVTQYILVNHPTLFRAAAASEGMLYAPSSYWLTSQDGLDAMHPALNRGPFGSQRENYERLSPVFKADRIRTPVLMEYLSRGIGALEFYAAVVSQGGQAELVFYPDDEHTFQQPAHRYHSMVRNFDWFNFWLLDEEDRSPEKRCQYERWRAMRSALSAAPTRPVRQPSNDDTGVTGCV